MGGLLAATATAQVRNRALIQRLVAVRRRTDTRGWVVQRRERTRHLIELGGLVQKAGNLNSLRDRIRASDYPRGTPDQVAMWREDLEESRANLAIEGMDLDAEDEALFAIMLEEGLSPREMIKLIRSLYQSEQSG